MGAKLGTSFEREETGGFRILDTTWNIWTTADKLIGNTSKILAKYKHRWAVSRHGG
jgi:hypothetical protein